MRRLKTVRRRVIPVLFATAVAAALMLFAAAAGEASAAPPAGQAVYFMFLGDVWKYDGQTGEASLFRASGSDSYGEPTLSLNGLGYTLVHGKEDFTNEVIFRSTALGVNPGDHVIAGADGAEVSPDGTRVLYETNEGGPALHIYSGLSRTTILDLAGALNGVWSSDGRYLAYNRGIDDHPFNDGIFIYDTVLASERRLAVNYPGETQSQSNVWGPQWSADGQWILLTKFVEGTGAVEVVRVSPAGGVPQKVMDVTAAEGWNYRWLPEDTGPGRLLIELDQFEKTIGDIYELTPTATGYDELMLLHDSSFGFAASLPADTVFNDIEGNPYRHAAVYLRITGVVSGRPDGGFHPEENVWRAQFAKMVVGALVIPVSESDTSPFTDLGADNATLYPHEYVAAAYIAQIVKGTSATTFGPYKDIVRAQLLSMVVRAADTYFPGRMKDPPAGWTGTLPSSDPTHGANIRRAEYNGLLSGVSLTGWDVWKPANRGECAQVVFNLLAVQGPLAQGE